MEEKQMQITPSEHNKDLITSYDFAVLRDSIGLYGQRLMLRLVEAANATGITEGLDFKHGTDLKQVSPARVESDLFGHTQIILPKTAIMGETEEYSKVAKDVEASMKHIIKYVDKDNCTVMFPFLTYAKFSRGNIILEVREELWNAMLNFTRGFRKLELKTALRLKSKFSFKIYKLVSGQQNPLNFSLSEFKEILGASWTEVEEQGKGKVKKIVNVAKEVYPGSPSHFLKRVVAPAKAELDSCSPYTFDYEPIYSRKTKTGRAAITGIRLIPLYQTNFRDSDLETNDMTLKYRNALGDFGLTVDQKNILMHKFNFTNKGIRNNWRLWETIMKNKDKIDLTAELDVLTVRSAKIRPSNPTGWVINSLKGVLRDAGIAINSKTPSSSEGVGQNIQPNEKQHQL